MATKDYAITEGNIYEKHLRRLRNVFMTIGSLIMFMAFIQISLMFRYINSKPVIDFLYYSVSTLYFIFLFAYSVTSFLLI